MVGLPLEAFVETQISFRNSERLTTLRVDRREGMDEEEGEEGEEIELLGAGGGVSKNGGAGGVDRSGAATPTPFALSTVPSAGQTPSRQVSSRDVPMTDAGLAKVDDRDRMDTS